jgi:hypothetical protein
MAKIDLRACYSTGPGEVALVLEMLRSAYESLPMDSARLDLAIRVQPRLLHALRQVIGRRLHIDTRCLQAAVSQQRCQADEIAWMVFEVVGRERVPERMGRLSGGTRFRSAHVATSASTTSLIARLLSAPPF